MAGLLNFHGIYRCLKNRKTSTCYFLIIAFVTFVFVKNFSVIVPSGVIFPWLNIVENVQILNCVDQVDRSDWPRAQQTKHIDDSQLTVVIVSAQVDFSRLPLTLAALACHLETRNLAEVILLVPAKDVHLLQAYFSDENAQLWPWKISLQSDDILLRHRHAMPYRLQMMFKLFVAHIIQTEFYLILDSDCVAVWPIHVDALLHRTETNNQSYFRAIYQVEGKAAHPKWWIETERLMRANAESCTSNTSDSLKPMGVTPIILSRTISLRTLCRLAKLYGSRTFAKTMLDWDIVRLAKGYMWTEYTMYYLTGQCTDLFYRYHVDNTLPSKNKTVRFNLYGLSVWSLADWHTQNQQRLLHIIQQGLHWRQQQLQQNRHQPIDDNSREIRGLFTVLQARHKVDPQSYHRLFYPLFQQYLSQSNETRALSQLINQMSENLNSFSSIGK